MDYLKTQIQRFDNGEIQLKLFIEKVREIVNDDSIYKQQIINEYLEKLAIQKEEKRKEANLIYLKKYMSDPEKRKRRSELDKDRYHRTKSVGNLKK